MSSAPWKSSPSFRRGRHQIKNRHHRRWLIIVIVLVALIFCYPFIEARLIQVERRKLQSDDLPSEANGLRIVYLSDIHYGFWFSDGDLGRLIAKINNLRPDLVLFGGDYATDYDSAVQFFRRLPNLARIHARYGIYGVLGETDYGESPDDRTILTEYMANADVTPLINQTVPVYIGSGTVYIAGLDDSSAGKPDLKSVSAALKPSDFVILLSHNPSVSPSAQQTQDGSGSLGWFDLGLFGHTHGGQMMFFDSLLGIADDVQQRYRSGWLTENRVSLLISRGVGTSVFPGRLFCSPQIHLIEMTSD